MIPAVEGEFAPGHQLDDDAWERIGQAVRASKSASTWKTYKSAWTSGFVPWCEGNGVNPFSIEPHMVAAYITQAAVRLRPSSIDVHAAAIAAITRLAGQDVPVSHPLVRQVLAGIRRRTRRPAAKKKALRLSVLARMVEALPDTMQGMRDRAMITCAWWGALRRSEVVALDVDDLDFEPEGVRVLVRRAKCDQEGRGAEVALPVVGGPTSPVKALRAWLDASDVKDHLFAQVDRWGNVRDRRLSAQTVGLVFKRAAERAGLDPHVVAGHSARRGFITEAAASNVPEHVIARQSRHRSVSTLRGYIESGSLWHGAASQVAATMP